MNSSILTVFLLAAFAYVTVCRELPVERVEKVSVRKRPTLPTGDEPSQLNNSRSMVNSTVVVLVVSQPSSSSSSSSSNVTHIRKNISGDKEGPIAPAGSPLRKQRLIRGSKKAATITRKEYLKKDWCRTEPFQQVVHEHGCVRKRIMNRFCYGQCNSFYIPKSDEEDQDGGSFRSCAYCMPIDSEWVDVVLHCPKKIPSRIVKKVQIVSQCKCMAVNLESGGLLLEPKP